MCGSQLRHKLGTVISSIVSNGSWQLYTHTITWLLATDHITLQQTTYSMPLSNLSQCTSERLHGNGFLAWCLCSQLRYGMGHQHLASACYSQHTFMLSCLSFYSLFATGLLTSLVHIPKIDYIQVSYWLLLLTSAIHSLCLLDRLWEDTQSIVQGPLGLVQDLLSSSTQYHGASLSQWHTYTTLYLVQHYTHYALILASTNGCILCCIA